MVCHKNSCTGLQNQSTGSRSEISELVPIIKVPVIMVNRSLRVRICSILNGWDLYDEIREHLDEDSLRMDILQVSSWFLRMVNTGRDDEFLNRIIKMDILKFRAMVAAEVNRRKGLALQRQLHCHIDSSCLVKEENAAVAMEIMKELQTFFIGSVKPSSKNVFSFRNDLLSKRFWVKKSIGCRPGITKSRCRFQLE